eukprot:1854908-Amphidinium_carterae.2
MRYDHVTSRQSFQADSVSSTILCGVAAHAPAGAAACAKATRRSLSACNQASRSAFYPVNNVVSACCTSPG